jgi:hypothetical protein
MKPQVTVAKLKVEYCWEVTVMLYRAGSGYKIQILQITVILWIRPPPPPLTPCARIYQCFPLVITSWSNEFPVKGC